MIDFENHKNEASVKNVLYDTHGLSLEKLNIDDRGRARLIALLLKTAVFICSYKLILLDFKSFMSNIFFQKFVVFLSNLSIF